jgi:hypothetical protein
MRSISVMSINKSSYKYSHDIDIWWGEADSRQNKYSSDSEKCRVVLVVAFKINLRLYYSFSQCRQL